MKIVCVGNNYVAHAKELGNQVPEEAVLFIKPASSLIQGDVFHLPTFSNEVHFELELAIKISKTGKNISKENANDFYEEIGLGIDFTARDLQRNFKSKGLPWEKAKAFDGSAYISPFHTKDSLNNTQEILFELHQNNEIKQIGNSKDMLFDFNEIIAQASSYFTLEKGDYILTGTPAGVGAVNSGDTLSGFLDGVKMFELKVK